MTYSIEIVPSEITPVKETGIIKRINVLSYGLLAYTTGCAGLFWLIFAIGGLAPVSLSELKAESISTAVLINISLIVLFGIQHSVMARSRFKKWITRYIPEAAERATYMLMSGVVSITALYFWQSIPGTVWSVDNTIATTILWSLYAIGWGYLLLSTFVTNHFELMGVRQVYLYFKNKPYTKLPFTRKYMYRYSRHPMMLGVLIGMWAIPVMSITHFIMATLFTLYMAVGVLLEEKDLVKNFGATYQNYKKEIAIFIPKLF